MQIDRREFLSRAACTGAVALMPKWRGVIPGTPFPELKATGSAGAIGMAHGKAFADLIERNVGFYLSYLGGRTHSDEQQLLACAQRFRGVMAKHFPALFEEMQGIAKGAGRKLDEVLLLNARTDLLVLAKRKAKQPAPAKNGAELPGCTALALIDRRRGKTAVALGQNWDWNRALRKSSVVLRLRPKDGRRIVTFTEAGMVGKIGCNDRGLGVCLNFLSHHSDDPTAEPGVPVHVLLRAVMGCDNLDDAVALVGKTPRGASANFLMAQARDQEPVAVDLEWAPRSVGQLAVEDGILVHTNHFKHGELGGRVKAGNSFDRDARAAKMAAELRESTRDPAERLREILTLGNEAPVSLSRATTQAGIVMDLSRNRLHLCIGPPHKGRWVRRPGA